MPSTNVKYVRWTHCCCLSLLKDWKLVNSDFWVNYLTQLLVWVQLCFLNFTTCSSALTDRKKDRHTDRQTPSSCEDSLQWKDANPSFLLTPPVPEQRRAPSLDKFSSKTQQRDTMSRRNKQTSWHITRNATSKHKQTQLEDCFFFFFEHKQTRANSQSDRHTDIQDGQSML